MLHFFRQVTSAAASFREGLCEIELLENLFGLQTGQPEVAREVFFLEGQEQATIYSVFFKGVNLIPEANATEPNGHFIVAPTCNWLGRHGAVVMGVSVSSWIFECELSAWYSGFVILFGDGRAGVSVSK
jgi:hypothetical protein